MFGSPDIPSGYNYFGGFAIAICVGPVKTLHSISNGDTVIWTGPLDISSADVDGKSTLTTTIGAIDFYWGTSTQNVNTALAGISIDFGSGPVTVPMTAFRRLCYAVCRDVAFGSQVSPPTLKFDVETQLNVLGLTAHTIGGDAVIPEAIYDYLTNTLYGAGIDPSIVDSASFIAAGNTTITEGLGASPSLDAFSSYRDDLGKMLQIIDAVLYFDGGKLKIKLNRQEDTTSAPSISEADLLDEPEPNNRLFQDTWNVTRVTYRDRDQLWQEDGETWMDDANIALTGKVIPQEFNMPWITTRAVAKIVAKLLGIKGGVPSMAWTLKLKPVWRTTLLPGQLIKVSFSKLGISNRICRISEVHLGGSGDRTVEIVAIEDQSRDPSHDYVIPADDFSIPGTLDANGRGQFTPISTTPRVSALPTLLKSGKSDGVLLVGNRPDATTSVLQLWWSYDPGTFSYQDLDQVSGFPIKGTVLCFWRINPGTWLFRVSMDTALDYTALSKVVSLPDVLAVVGERKYQTTTPKDQHQVLSPWLLRPVDGRFTLLTSSIIDVELKDGEFSTDNLTLEDGVDDANYPTQHIYLGRLEQFEIYPTNSLNLFRAGGNSRLDSAEVRYFKAPVQNPFSAQGPSDVTAVTFSKLDTTMCPDGTFSRDWGSRAPTAYELLDQQDGLLATDQTAALYADVSDLDAAIGAVIAGTATADQQLLVAHIDLVLGKMATTTQTYYSDE